MIKHIQSNWNIEEFYNLDYSLALFHDNSIIDHYVSKGHTKENMFIFKYSEPNPMPSVIKDYIFPNFSYLNNLTCAVNLFKPANYLPYHSDSYFRYKQLFNITDEVIVRSVIMLEDWEPGQIILVGKKSYSGWVAGDCFSWENYEMHSFYNMSLVDRYALQITGTLK